MAVVVPFIIKAVVSTAISMAISWLFAPSTKGPRLKDLGATGQGYGPPIPEVFGRMSVSGSIIWASDLIEKKKKSGGKGGGGSVTTYSYSQHVALAVCKGEGDVLRIWAAGKLIWDVTNAQQTGVSKSDNKIIPFDNVTVYPGSETQGVSSLIESFKGVGATSAYRGVCYVTLQNLQLETFGNRLPPFQIEVGSARLNTTSQGFLDLGYVGDIDQRLAMSQGFTDYNSSRNVFVSVSANTGTNSIIFYETDTLDESTSLVATVAVGSAVDTIASVAYVADKNQLWVVTAEFTGNILKFDADTYALLDTVTDCLHSYPDGIFYFEPTQTIITTDGNVGPKIQYSASDYADDGVNLPAITLADYGWKVVPLSEDAFAVPTQEGVAIFRAAADSTVTLIHNYSLGFAVTDVAWCAELNQMMLANDGTDNRIYIDFSKSAVPMFGDKDELIDFAGGTASAGNAGGYSTFGINSVYYNATIGEYIATMNARIYQFDPLTKTQTASYTSTGPTGSLKMFPNPHDRNTFVGFDVGTQHAWKITPQSSYLQVDDVGIPLQDVVSNICEDSGLDSSEYDVTDLEGVIEGYVISRPMSARDKIEPLRAAYWFDGAESEGQIKFKMRGGNPVDSIPEADIGATEGNEINPEPFKINRGNEEELPYQVDVHYYKKGSEYEEGVQYERVQNTSSTTLNSMELAIVLSDVKARDVAAVTLHITRLERTSYEFSTSKEYSHLEPMDVVTVAYDGQSFTIRLTEKDESGGVITFKGVAEDSSLYADIGIPSDVSGFYTATENTIGGVPGEGSGGVPTIPQLATTYPRFLDIPPLSPSHSGLGIYVSVSPNRQYTNDTWDGAIDFYSLDGGVEFTEGTVFNVESVVGEATTTLGTHTGGATVDLINRLSIEVAGELASTSWDGLLAGQNAMLVGSEIIQFQIATLVGTASNGINKNYTVSKLMRGMLGTEQYISTHVASEICVLLDNRIARFVSPETRVGDTVYRVASSGQDVDDLTSQTVTNTGICLKPFSPVNLRGFKSAAASWDIDLLWDRRDRLAPTLLSGSDIPMSEVVELYDIEIYTSDFVTLKRTVSSNTVPAYSYSNADQVTDFGSTQSSIGLKVYQISATVGRGFVGQSVVVVI